ncbi:unnamed protein product [Sympodiomycopsis kandeliae]
MSILANVTISIVLLIVTFVGYSYSRRQDPYQHLNQDGPEQGKPQWMNMGWWTLQDGHRIDDKRTFHQACESLARRLYEAAGCEGSVKILDIGHGPGDSLLLLGQEFRPSHLTGVTLSPSEADKARQRVNALVQGGYLQGTQVQVLQGEAVDFLHRQRSDQSYDRIICLDCAYHFKNRLKFFEAAFEQLEPDRGRLALFDLVTSWPQPYQVSPWYRPSMHTSPPAHAPTLLSRAKLAILQRLSSSTLIDVTTYHDMLIQAGFREQDIAITDVSHNVFPGFARFLTTYGSSDTPLGDSPMLQAALRWFGTVVQKWAHGGDEAYVRGVIVIAARKTP